MPHQYYRLAIHGTISRAPSEWTQVTVDLWQDAGDFNLTGIAPTAMGGTVLFDRLSCCKPSLPNQRFAKTCTGSVAPVAADGGAALPVALAQMA